MLTPAPEQLVSKLADHRRGDDRQQTQTPANIELESVVCPSVVCCPAGFETSSETTISSPSATLGPACTGAVLRLLVRNHPGVMSHVCGLFARRGFNVEGILCVPIGDGLRSVILLVVNEDERLEQLIRQLRKLEDVVDVHREPEARGVFAAIGSLLH